MQKLKLLLPLALFLGVFFVACHDEDPLGNNYELVDVTFAGRILDENGDGLQGALVKAGQETAITDANGIFRLAPTRLAENHAIISVSKSGYFDLSRAYIVADESRQNITLQLLSKVLVGSVSSGAGGTVNVPGGAKLNFPASAITDENGNAYNGTVQIFARYLDPTLPNLALNMPGNLTALNAAGELRSLATFGMIGVELSAPGGQKLKIAAGQEVEIRVPIDPGILSSAPASMPLWHYDEALAYWIEEGVAQKIGNEYVGKVSHFSWWNYDAPYPSVQVSGKVFIGDNQHPLEGVHVWIGPENNGQGWGSGHGITDENGCFAGAIPKDMLLKIIILSPTICNQQPIYTAIIGPFSADVVLPDIILPTQSLQFSTISGHLVDCNGNSIANGYTKISLSNSNHFAFADANGNFEMTSIYCGNAVSSGTATGYDILNLLESDPVSFSIPPFTVNVGDLSVCTTLSEYIRFSLDGAPEFLAVAPLGRLDAGKTFITTLDSTQVSGYLNFSFENIGAAGTFPIISMEANQFFATDLGTLSTTVIAPYNNVGDLILGTFGGNFKDFSGTNHTINGSYRVKRN